MNETELFQRVALALAIGMLVGVERGWKQRFDVEERRVAGLRTYTLIGLFGGIAGALTQLAGPAAFAALAVVFGLAWIAYKLWETWVDNDLSVTGTVAGLLTFALGAYAVLGDTHLAAAAAVALTGVLAFKEATHAWVKALSWEELRSALLILAASVIALPLLPDRALDPYGAFNPRELWALTILIASVSFAGYVALRVLGDKAGPLVGAAIGALVSSTVVTLELARRAKSGEVAPLRAAGAATLANTVMFSRIGVLIAAFAPQALNAALPAVIAAVTTSLVALAALFFLARRRDKDGHGTTLRNPLDVLDVAKFAAILAAVTVAARLVAHFYGDAGLLIFAASAGLVDVNSVALAVGGLVRGGYAASVGAGAILLAAGVNTLSKTVIGATIGGGHFALAYGAASLAALSAGAAGLFFVMQAS